MKRLLKNIVRDSRGTTLIEFAFVLPLLLALILGTLEFAFMLYQRGTMEVVTHSVARKALTGNAMYGSQEDLAGELNAKLESVLFNDGTITVSSDVYENFQSFGTGASATGVGGGSSQIVRYTVNYDYGFLTPLPMLLNGMDNEVTLTATTFVKHEAY